MSMMEMAALRRTVEDLEARLRALENGIAGAPDPLRALGLTASEALILGALRRRQFCTREFLLSVLYGYRDDTPDPKCLDVFVCTLRKKLGLRIRCTYSSKGGGPSTGGYALTENDIRILGERMAA